MHITVVAVGSRGDVQPYVALAQGLARAGHVVRVAAHAPFGALVEPRGLEFATISPNPRTVLETEAAVAWLEARNPFTFLRRLGEVSRPSGIQLANDILQACEGTDAIVSSPLGAAGYHVAEARGIPHASALLQPVNPTGAFASALVPHLDGLGPTFNRLSHHAVALGFDLPFRSTVNAWRRDVLGLPPIRDLHFYRRIDRERRPVLYGFSERVVPRPPEWGPWIHVCGYWQLRTAGDWRPSRELADFLAAGPPPVYVGFGSMRTRRPEQLGALVAAGLRRAGVRGVIGSGWGALAVAPSDDLLGVGEVPHDWLFPRCAAVVHHGGAGTTATALHAGVPSFAVPFFADQPFWGLRSARLGVGPRPISLRRLDERGLAAAVQAAVTREDMRRSARAVAKALGAEDGVGTAVEVFSRDVASRP